MNLLRSFKLNGWRDRPIVGLSILVMLGLISLLLYQRAVKPLRIEYEGVIVDKSLDIYEDQTGSRIQLLLLIKDDEGRQFNVVADEELYERAKIGMRIKRTKEGWIFTPEE
jgi:hypothetical protein